MEQQYNIFGQELIPCSSDPLTGYFRDGCCNTDQTDIGVHTVCIVATEPFLDYSKAVGNDLSTPMPEWSFPGVLAGEKWCLCAKRFLQAHEAGFAPKVVLEATNEKTLDVVPMDVLIEHAYYSKQES
ncbi:MAG: DUF2237 domain-containing protein [Flavobacteriales bacterium]|nr:DUF2237 domain-containing protein [Flavobacteriales bacterium]